MDSKYTRRTSLGDYSKDDVCKQGFFIKSPPLHLFHYQSSWKRRHFVLSKSSNGCLLKYHNGQHNKGCIEINKSSKIEIGIGDPERMAAVKRMFKCQFSEVMTIKTEERTYYLIETDRNQTEEWANFLFAACKEKETNTWQTLNQKPRNRSLSSPDYLCEYSAAVSKEDLHEDNEYGLFWYLSNWFYHEAGRAVKERTDSAVMDLICIEYAEQEISADKKRPNSDPIPQEPREESCIYESPRKCVRHQRYLTSNHSVCEEQSKGKSEKEEEEESEEPYYVTPRSVQAELDHIIAECNIPVENLSPHATDGDLSEVYMPMKDLVIKEEIQPVCKSVELVTCPRSQKNSTDLEGDMGTQQLIESNTSIKEPPPEKKTKQLTVVQLSKLFNKITDDSQLEEVDILLPQNDAINYLTFTEAIGRICVSQWKGPHHLNCIFHQGDHILAVNDLHVMNIDEVLLFIKRSTRKEVKLTVRRLPDSDVFPH